MEKFTYKMQMNIKMDLKRTGLDGEKLFFFLAQERQGRVGGFLIS
jgi:hypothetical protein